MHKYLYKLNYKDLNWELAKLELNILLNEEITCKHLISNNYVDANQSYFIHSRTDLLAVNKDPIQLLKDIEALKITCDDFKIVYERFENDDLEYEFRMRMIKEISYIIDGIGVINNPSNYYMLTRIDDMWYFGLFHRSQMPWKLNNQKPYSYSNAVEANLALSLVNLATNNQANISLVDPCCGVGTVLIEAARLNYQIDGYEHNEMIALNAIKNLRYFNYPTTVNAMDMNLITNNYDVAILDIPYNHTTAITKQEQENILRTCKKISHKLILVANEDMKSMLDTVNYQISNQVCLYKNDSKNFTRYIYILN